MRRMICLILAVIFCVSLACPVFAAPSPGRGDHENCDCGDNCVCTKGEDCGCDCFDGGECNGSPSHSGKWNPKTGDIILMWVAVMVVALVALGVVVVIYRKKFSN